MKKFTFLIVTVLFSILNSSAQNSGKANTNPQAPQIGSTKWSLDPFEHAIFVENKGQFDTVLPGVQIFFEAQLGAADAYFTANGILYKHIETAKLDFSKGDPDQNGPPERDFYYLTTEWQGASSNTTVEAADELSYYYTYPKGTHDSYIANVFKKITYHNIYPGIDITYSFPEGRKDLEYTIIIHPGADLSKVQLKYIGTSGMHIDGEGNVVVNNDIGMLKETTPVGYYQEDHTPVTINAQANNPIESFTAHNPDASKTLVIDPTITWTTNPAFTGGAYDYAYDLDYDNQGNIYAYGGGAYPLQLVKLNSAGAIQWTFNATTMTSSTDFYGDMAVDKHSLESYITEGWNASGGARVEKVNSHGVLMATDPGNSGFNEMWRIQSSICPAGFVVFGNGTCCPDHACMLDTTMASITPVNILGPTCTTGYHDMALTAVDPFGNFAWTGCTHSLIYTTWNNTLIKSPIPALTPSAYQTPMHYSFKEIGSMFYAPNLVFNAMNGLVCGRSWLFAYNGDTLKQISKTTGAINAVAQVSATPFQWGGVDVDLCDNVYLANNKTIQVYDGSSLTMTSSLPVLPGTIYDLKLGTYTSQLLYACGQNFVSCVTLGPPATIPIVVTRTPSNCSACSGTATASAMPCGVLDTMNVTYLWSDGETTRTASHLCSGVDTVKVTVECGLTYTDTLTIPVSSGGIIVTRDSTNATCSVPGSASVTVTGGHPPYTYSWTNGSTTSSTGPVGAGVYCVGVRDNSDCSDSICITVLGNPLPIVTITPNPDTICAGGQIGLTAAGALTYAWTPPGSGLSCYTCPNPTASPAVTTTYTVVGTDAHGCKNKDSVIVVVNPLPVILIAAPQDTVCPGGSVALTVSGAGVGGTYTWNPSALGLSCYNCTNPTATPTATTVYTVTGTDAQGCSANASVTVYLQEPPTITVMATKTSLCQGQSVSMTASATNTTTPYTWQPGGMTGPNVTVTPTVTTTYTVSAGSVCGVATATVTIVVNPIPNVAIAADIYQGCVPLCVQFRNNTTISQGGISQYVWAFGNGDTLQSKNPIYCYSSSGVYNVKLTAVSDSGCSMTLDKGNMITVFKHPSAVFTYSPEFATILQPTIQFTSNSSDTYGALVEYTWSFGDASDSNSNLANPSHTYQDTGSYCPSLVVMNEHGCVDTATNCLIINPIFTLYIPSGFTPNGDGKNEVFMAKGKDIKSFEMYIFDRWGMQLFHSTNINEGWNGTVNGGSTVAQEDTYIYIIKAYDSNNKEHTYTGNINLIK